MASLESLQTSSVGAQSFTGRTVDDKSIALEIVYVAQATGDTPVVTVATATGITLADSLTTTGSLAFATYSNLGKLVDKINSYARWEARIIDGLRSTATESSVLLPDSVVSAVTAHGESVYRIFIDQSVNDEVYYRVSANRGVLKNDNGCLKTQIPQGSHRVKITGISYNENINGVENSMLQVYEYNPASQSETLIWSAITVDATATTHDFTLNPLTSGYGCDLVVKFKDSEITDDIVNFLEVNYIRE